jgi:hypothetical protein
MGRFGLTAMAASLLGRVIRYTNDAKNTSLCNEEEAIILDRALTALTTATHDEGLARGMGVCSPTTFCHR